MHIGNGREKLGWMAERYRGKSKERGRGREAEVRWKLRRVLWISIRGGWELNVVGLTAERS